MDQREQKQKISVSDSVKELKPDDLEKITGGGQPVTIPKSEEKDDRFIPVRSP